MPARRRLDAPFSDDGDKISGAVFGRPYPLQTPRLTLHTYEAMLYSRLAAIHIADEEKDLSAILTGLRRQPMRLIHDGEVFDFPEIDAMRR